MIESRRHWFREFTESERYKNHDRYIKRFIDNVIINPSGFRLLQMARTHRENRGGLRGIVHKDVQYWWHAYYGSHLCGWIHLVKDDALGRPVDCEAELHCTEYGSVYLETRNAVAFEEWMNRKPFVNAFKDGFFYGPTRDERRLGTTNPP